MKQSSLVLSRGTDDTKSRLQCLVSSKGFEAVTAIFILANAALIAYSADHAANNIHRSDIRFCAIWSMVSLVSMQLSLPSVSQHTSIVFSEEKTGFGILLTHSSS